MLNTVLFYLQHVQNQADAIKELEGLISLNGSAIARPRSDVRTLL